MASLVIGILNLCVGIWPIIKQFNKNLDNLAGSKEKLLKKADSKESSENTWKCSCGTKNDMSVNNCKSCHKFRPSKRAW